MIEFWKYEGAGNDFVLFEDYEGTVPRDAEFVRKACDRSCGIGADGLLYLSSVENADARMVILNADGSEAEMCGNGIRCAAKHLYDVRRIRKKSIRIETKAGMRDVGIEATGGAATMLHVEMGAPILDGRRIPMDHDGLFVEQPLRVDGAQVTATALSMGNPHLVTFDELSDSRMERLGPLLEAHPLFPHGTNVEFVRLGEDGLDVRVYERGSAWTKACGTGACASVVAAVLRGLVSCDRPVRVRLPGGELVVTVGEAMDRVLMSGPARLVFLGRYVLGEASAGTGR